MNQRLDDKQTLVMERTFDVPVERLFRAFTDPDQLRQWWGPAGTEVYHCEFEPREGAAWRFGLRMASGEKRDVGGVVRRVAPNAIAFTWRWLHDGASTVETLVSLLFSPQGERRSSVRLVQERFETSENRDSHRQGWSSTFDNLASFIVTEAGA